MENEMSIKQLLVKIVKECVDLPTVEEGVVIKEDPLTITLLKDKKMRYSEEDLIVPERMRNHQITVGDRVNLLLINAGSICYVLDRA